MHWLETRKTNHIPQLHRVVFCMQTESRKMYICILVYSSPYWWDLTGTHECLQLYSLNSSAGSLWLLRRAFTSECTVVRLGSSQTVLQWCFMQHGSVFAEMRTKISESHIWGIMVSSTKNNYLRDTVLRPGSEQTCQSVQCSSVFQELGFLGNTKGRW